MEMGFHLLRRAGYDEAFIDDVARVMEYTKAYDAYRDDRETAEQPAGPLTGARPGAGSASASRRCA